MDLPSFDAAGLETRDELIGFLTSVLEASTEYSMIVIDRSGLIVLWNEGARRLYGYESGEIIGKPHTVLHTEDDVRAGLPGQMLARVLDHGKFEGTVERRRKDGSRFTARVVETPRRDAHGSLSGFLLISSDITDELRLQSAGRAKDRFLANMSHELRTPLNAILGFTGTLLTGLPGPLNDVQNKQLRTVQTSGRHLLSLINDLLDVARIESGTIDLHVEPIDCGELLSEVAMELKPLAAEKGVGLEVFTTHESLIHRDRRSLRQILINLANNAIKFTDHGAVRLELSRQTDDTGSRTRFTVTDTGCGIKTEDQEQLFAAFQQIEGDGADSYEGTGLGLHISQTLATAIGAEIAFESEFGTGSTFTLELRE